MNSNFKNFIKTNGFVKPIYNLTLKPRSIRKKYLFKKYGVEVLEKFQIIMKSINVDFWLEFGTLLGAYREKDFIVHDDDIDVGLFLNNDYIKIQKTLEKSGFKLIQQIEVDNCTYGLEQTYVYKGVYIDLFYFTKKEEEIHCHVFKTLKDKTWEETIMLNGGVIVQEHTFPYMGLKFMKFQGLLFNVPSNIEEHLSANYGDEFMIENSKWNYTMASNIDILDNKIGIVNRY